MSYTQHQAQMLVDIHSKLDDGISADLLSFIENDFNGFQKHFNTLYDVVDALELDDDAEAWDWVRQTLDEDEVRILDEEDL